MFERPRAAPSGSFEATIRSSLDVAILPATQRGDAASKHDKGKHMQRRIFL